MKREMLTERPASTGLKKPKMVKEDPADVEMKDVENKENEEENKKDADLLTLEGNCYLAATRLCSEHSRE